MISNDRNAQIGLHMLLPYPQENDSDYTKAVHGLCALEHLPSKQLYKLYGNGKWDSYYVTHNHTTGSGTTIVLICLHRRHGDMSMCFPYDWHFVWKNTFQPVPGGSLHKWSRIKSFTCQLAHESHSRKTWTIGIFQCPGLIYLSWLISHYQILYGYIIQHIAG